MSVEDADRIDASACGATAPDTSGDFYKHVVQSMDEGVVIADLDEYILFANPAAGRIVDYSQRQLIGMNLSRFILQEDWSNILAETQKRILGKVSRYTTRVRRRDGDVRQVEVTFSPLRDSDGRVVGAAGVFLDVTEQRRAEQRLRQSERDKAVILSTVSELVNYQDKDLRVIWANRAAGESVGRDPAELVGRYCYEIWHGRDRPCDGCPLVRAIESGRQQEGRMTSPEGRVWNIRSYPVHGPDGQVAGAVEVTSEITEQVRAAQALQRHTERLEALRGLDKEVLNAHSLSEVCRAGLDCIARLVECSYVGVAEFDLENGRARVLATNVDDTLDSGLLKGGSSLELNKLANLKRYMQSEVCAVGDFSSVPPKGPVERNFFENGLNSYFAVPLLSEGCLIGVLCVGSEAAHAFCQEDMDIAYEVANPLAIAIDRERRERERAHLAAVVEQTNEAVAVLGPSGETIYANAAAERITGYSAGQIRQSGHEVFLADDTARLLYQQMWHELSEGRTWSGRANLRRADGSVFPADINCSP
ncbi:MAG: PAS domain S-box protein, partial [Planctomycetota bacterium]